MHLTLTYPVQSGGRFFRKGYVRGYRFGFNGKEKVDEVYGDANAYDFGARIYDPRLGRWLAVDPLAYTMSSWSPYNFVFNSPLSFIDPTGMAPDTWIVNSETGESTHVDDGSDDIVIVNAKDYAWASMFSYDFDTNKEAVSSNKGYQDVYKKYLDGGDRYSPNEFGMYQFPESGRGFARYTNTDGSSNGNNENYTVNGVKHKTDNWASAETFLSFYKTIQEFHTSTGAIIHYGDISAYNPKIDLRHSTHFTGNSIDIHYMGSGGIELRGTDAYSKADVELTNTFFNIAESNGFNKNYTFGNRFNHKGNRNHSLHKDHLHIGR